MFYLTDNSGVISIIRCSSKWSLTLVLRHHTHRSLLRSCVIDDITLAVSDKHGNILIYRSFYPVSTVSTFHVAGRSAERTGRVCAVLSDQKRVFGSSLCALW